MRRLLPLVTVLSLMLGARAARADGMQIADWPTTRETLVLDDTGPSRFTNNSHTNLSVSDGKLLIHWTTSVGNDEVISIALANIKRIDFDSGDKYHFPLVIIVAKGEGGVSVNPPSGASMVSWNLEFSSGDNALAQSISEKLNGLIGR